jgi:16S rRNA (guanine527-N7)-methyltransferase
VAVKAEHLKLLEEGAATIGLRLDAEQRALLARHVDVLLKWNKSVNLTAITEPAEVVEKHLLDSLALAPLVPKGTMLDAGTGGGFPGLPIRVARPDVEVLLVDSSQKKIAFLKNFIAETRITGVQAIALRLSGNPANEGISRVHSAVARALAPPPEWLPLAEHYVLPGGLVFCMLGPSDPLPTPPGDLELQQELAYKLPITQAERRLAVYKRT